MTLYLHYWTLISFSALVATSPFWPILPDWRYLFYAGVILVMTFKYRRLRGFVGLALACVVVLAHGNFMRFQTETLFQAGDDISITAEVDSFFTPIKFGFRGIVIVRSINGQTLTTGARAKIKLSAPIALVPQQIISADVTLRPIVGVVNEVGFDSEQYALATGLVGQASINTKRSFYVVSGTNRRAQLIDSVKRASADTEHQAFIQALLFGLRSDISSQTWQQLKQSGLSHLVAISGLHIGIAFSLGWLMGLVLFALFPRWVWLPMATGLALATTYAWLAGFSIPTQRALLMCIVLCCVQLRGGNLSYSFKWLLVLVALLFIAPFSVVSASLWMSMYAVACVFVFIALCPKGWHWLAKLLLAQMVIVIAMAPLVSWLYQGVSVAAVVYNLVFVPWFSWVVIPWLFVATTASLLCDSLSWLWIGLDWLFVPLDWALEHSNWGWWELSHHELYWLSGAVLLVALMPFLAIKAVAIVLCILLILSQPWRAKPLWVLEMMDIGHGLAVVIRQEQRVLLYDTGAAWNDSSIAEQVLTPYLVKYGVKEVDWLAISHFDNDHAGGFGHLSQRWSPNDIMTSQVNTGNITCVQGKSWQWGRLSINALWPPARVARAFNPHSCVLKIAESQSGFSLLLTGDVEAIAEWLLIRGEASLDAEIMTVPHHGSRTSSLPDFIKAVNPQIALVSTAKDGRWDLPNKQVVERYQQQGARLLDTGSHGQITVKFYSDHYTLTTMRAVKGNTWYRQMLRNRVE